MSRTETCEERIASELLSRQTQVAEFFDRESGGDEFALEELDQFALHMSRRIHYRIDLSTGGPADWLEITMDSEGSEIERIEYVFQDWFDGARAPVRLDDPSVASVIRYCEYMVEAWG